MVSSSRLVRTAAAYFAGVFGLGMVLGTIRTVWLAPLAGPFVAVAAELPLMLAASWLWAGYLLKPHVPSARQALAMGGIAFAMLLGAELLLAWSLTGPGVTGWAEGMSTPQGALGLSGQLVFALLPWIWVQRRTSTTSSGARAS